MSEAQERKIEKIHCNQCHHPTRHEVLLVREQEEPEEVSEESSMDWRITYTVLECLGCGNVTLRRQDFSFVADIDETEYYPPFVSRRMPSWGYELPDDFESLMKECYTALHADSKSLSLMGARTLVELFMNLNIGDIGGFDKKLNKLVDSGFLSKKNKELLEAALDAGHAAIHRAHKPTNKDVNIVFDIVENLIQTLVLKGKVDGLKKHTPPRKTLEG